MLPEKQWGSLEYTYPLPALCIISQALCWGCEIEKMVKPVSWMGIGGGCFATDFFLC